MYRARIKALAPSLDPRHVEAFMRIELGMLDALSPERFAAEVGIASCCVMMAGAQQAEALAKSYGL
jgi:hypothetical protein